MPERYEHLDGLRGVAALNVMISHAFVAFDFALYTGSPAHSRGAWDLALSAWPLLLPVSGANFSVCVFLVLSGFVLAHVFSRTPMGIPALTVKRAFRLGIPILAVNICSWALLAAGFMSNQTVAGLTRSEWLTWQFPQAPVFMDALREGLYGGLTGAGGLGGVTYNSNLWTMPIEFAGSAMLIVLFASRGWFARRGFSRVQGGLALLALSLLLYPLYLSLIAVGAAIFLLEPRRRLPRAIVHPAALTVVLLIALVLGTVPYSQARGPWWDAVVSAVPSRLLIDWWPLRSPILMTMHEVAVLHAAGAVLLLLLIETSLPVRQALTRPFAKFLGLISFPLYLVHIPIMASVGCGVFLLARAAGLPEILNVAIAGSAFAAASIAAAAIFALVVERGAISTAALTGKWTQQGIDRLRYPPARSA